MTRILTYNILVGGKHRVDQLVALIGSKQPDIVGLVEATSPQVVEEIAQRLGMQFYLSGQGKHRSDWQIALLSRLPIVHTQLHTYPDTFTRRHFLEVCVEESDGTQLTIFVIHQTSRFNRGLESNRVRRREVEKMLMIMSAQTGKPHLVMGDFNSLAPHDPFKGSLLLRYFMPQTPSDAKPRRRRHPILRKIVRTSVHSPLFAPAIDRISRLYAQGGIDLILKAGYVDSFRSINPREPGFTFHSSVPCVRIDFIFASPEVAQRLSTCAVVTEGGGVSATGTSDHMPVYAEFAPVKSGNARDATPLV